jgi:hypothetical protein
MQPRAATRRARGVRADTDEWADSPQVIKHANIVLAKFLVGDAFSLTTGRLVTLSLR